MKKILTIALLLLFSNCGNNPATPPNPKAIIDPIIGLFISSSYALGDGSSGSSGSSGGFPSGTCSGATEMKVGLSIEIGIPSSTSTKFYKLVNDQDTDFFLIKLRDSNSSSSTSYSGSACLIIGKENQQIDSTSGYSQLDYPTSSSSSSSPYSNCYSGGSRGVEIAKNAYRCIGVTTQSSSSSVNNNSAKLDSHWTSDSFSDVLPTVSSFSPTSGPPGTVITITGKKLAYSSYNLNLNTGVYTKVEPSSVNVYSGGSSLPIQSASYSEVKLFFPNYLTNSNITSSSSGSSTFSYGTFTKTSSPAMYSRTIPACTYSSISGTNVTFNSSSSFSSSSTLVPIGFNFTYFGASFDKIFVSRYGFASFMKNDFVFLSSTSSSSSYSGMILLPWYNNSSTIDTSSTIQYSLSGTAGSRIFTIQWANYPDFSGSVQYRFNYQIKLYEGTNLVEFQYGSKSGSGSGWSSNIGINNAVGGTGNYMDAISGSTSTATSYNSNTTFPLANTCYRFTP
jgi:hypothetical protein